MTQAWGVNWYHFTAEHLPRIMVFLDVLLENEDVMIAVHFRVHCFNKELGAHVALLNLLGIKRQRIVRVKKEVRSRRITIHNNKDNNNDTENRSIVHQIAAWSLQGRRVAGEWYHK